MFETDFLKIYRNKTWGGGGEAEHDGKFSGKYWISRCVTEN